MILGADSPTDSGRLLQLRTMNLFMTLHMSGVRIFCAFVQQTLRCIVRVEGKAL